MKKYEYEIAGLDCAACANEIQEGLNKNPEIKNANVNFAKMKLTYETDTLSKEEIEKIVQSIEPEVELLEVNSKSKDLKNEKAQKENRKKLWLHILRLVIGAIVAGVGLYVPMPKVASTIFIVLGYAILLFKTAKNAVKLLFKSKTINENLLITISCIGAYLVGKSSEGLMVIILYEIGKILEEKAINKTRKSISDLMDIKPEYANLKKGDEIEIVEPSEVKVGDIVVAKQGEKIPLDGVVVKGTASLNTASLTGESKPQDVDENDIVLSGSIVLEGLLEIKVTEEYENSTVSKILELVENATDKKAKTETFVNKAAKIYTPIVIGIAILVGIFLPLISNVTYGGENGSIYRALIFLVISCPCAIAISVPLCYFSGIGKSSKEGILIKGSDYLDELKDVKEIVFDIRKEKNPCSLCANLRRGILNSSAIAHDCNKIALGHNEDDVLETFFLNLLYAGNLSTFAPTSYMDRSKITLIRPMVYIPEKEVRKFVRRQGIEVMPKVCPMDGVSKRESIKELISKLVIEIPTVRANIMGAIRRSNINGWKEF